MDKLAQVRALLAKAEATPFAIEAETYTAKAVELMARHGLDEALVNAKRAVRETPTSKRVEMDGSYTREKATLLGWILHAMRGKAVHHQARGGRRTLAVTLVGFASDIERAEMLYTSVLLQATSQMARITADEVDPYSWDGPSKQTIAAYKRSWLVGFANEVHQRVKAAEEAAVQASETAHEAAAGTSTAMVLVDRKAQVEQAYEDMFPTLGKGKARTLTGGGYSRGVEAGRKADLGGTRVGAGARAALH